MSVAMSTHTAQLKQIEEIAEGTMAFHLEIIVAAAQRVRDYAEDER